MLNLLLPRYLCMNIFQGICIVIMWVQYVFSWFWVLVCVWVWLHSNEAGEAAWQLIHHSIPPWPTVPSEEHSDIGLILVREMVHLPPNVATTTFSSLQPTSHLRHDSLRLIPYHQFYLLYVHRDRLIIMCYWRALVSPKTFRGAAFSELSLPPTAPTPNLPAGWPW